jgi:hypothetical protein
MPGMQGCDADHAGMRVKSECSSCHHGHGHSRDQAYTWYQQQYCPSGKAGKPRQHRSRDMQVYVVPRPRPPGDTMYVTFLIVFSLLLLYLTWMATTTT